MRQQCRFLKPDKVFTSRNGVLLPIVVFLILGIAAALPLIIDMSETTLKRTQYSEEWARIQWAMEGANQKQLESSSVVADPFSGVVTTVATFTYPETGGSFDVAVVISEGRTLLARHRTLTATAKAYRNGQDAGYDLEGLAAATVSVPGVAAGSEHSFAWKKDGKLYSWGRNNRGQLGLDNITDYSLAQQTQGGACPSTSLPYYTQGWMVAGGGFHSLALDYYGGVYSWGLNSHGQLGHSSVGANTYVDVPQTVIHGGSHLTNVSDLAAGSEFSLALTNSGNVLAWGNDARGQLGYDPVDNFFTTKPAYQAVPQTVVGLSGRGSVLPNIVGIAAGLQHAMAIDKAGNIYGWGDNSYSQLGAAFSENYSQKPIKINETVATWVAQIPSSGNNKTPSTTQFYIPVPHFIASFSVEMDSSNGGWGTDQIRLTHTNGTVIRVELTSQTSIGSNRYRWTYEKTGESASYILSDPGTYTVAVVNRRWFFGYYDSSLNGDWYRNSATGMGNRGVFSFYGQPTEEPTDFFGMAAGGDFSMAVRRSGNQTILYTWGRNDYGQLGQGDTSVRNRMAPVANFPAGNEKIRTVCAGREHALALTESGKVYAWGRNNNGQLGLNNTTDRSSPVQITSTIGSAIITGIAAGSYHSLAIDSEGNVYSWGLQTNGRVGNGLTSGNRLTPVKITGFP